LRCARIDFGRHALCRHRQYRRLRVIDGARAQALVSHNGIVGHNMRKVQEFTLPCPPGALCILHSDGIHQWDLAAYPGLLARSRRSSPRC
jgi:hypothetical protein